MNFIRVKWTILFLCTSVFCVWGCASSSQAVSSPLISQVYEVKSKLYIFGKRRGKPEVWFIASPEFAKNNPEVQEYEEGSHPTARLVPWKIYSHLSGGDRIAIRGSKWVSNPAYEGYQVKAEILSGPYEGTKTELMELVLAGDTDKPLEEWNPYKDPFPVPGKWKIDDAYLKLIGVIDPGSGEDKVSGTLNSHEEKGSGVFD